MSFWCETQVHSVASSFTLIELVLFNHALLYGILGWIIWSIDVSLSLGSNASWFEFYFWMTNRQSVLQVKRQSPHHQ